MKIYLKVLLLWIVVILTSTLFSSFKKEKEVAKFTFPYKKAGLTERQAAAHLLNRFTFGIKAGDVDRVVEMGLENWFRQQLSGKIQDQSLNERLRMYADLHLSNVEVANKFPRNAQVVQMAIKEGFMTKDSISKRDPKKYKEQLNSYLQAKGLKPQQELFKQFINQKILRAAYSNNQLNEVLTDFWFNHFNVSLTKPQTAIFIPAYERDVIRPHITGKFKTLLIATASSPAMLTFLDNFSNTGLPLTTLPEPGKMKPLKVAGLNKKIKNKKGGLNENYAREVMELHTLGVDAGYTQNDVTNAARVLTGWTVTPMRNQRFLGSPNDADFKFVPARHDAGQKTVLGRTFQDEDGFKEGIELLTMLAENPATAKFISGKLASRFVCDQPPAVLIDRMAKSFSKSDGNIKQVLLTMVSSPEFWSAEALTAKTKSPFELGISAVRGLNADLKQPYQLYNWISRMGQKFYYYQAPTGWPDRGEYWINTGALLNRMNFGLAIASQRIPGIKVNLLALNHNAEPESAHAALLRYGNIILPERNLEATINRLRPSLNDNIVDSTKVSVQQAQLAQVVGLIIGSPEFQRR